MLSVLAVLLAVLPVTFGGFHAPVYGTLSGGKPSSLATYYDDRYIYPAYRTDGMPTFDFSVLQKRGSDYSQDDEPMQTKLIFDRPFGRGIVDKTPFWAKKFPGRYPWMPRERRTKRAATNENHGHQRQKKQDKITKGRDDNGRHATNEEDVQSKRQVSRLCVFRLSKRNPKLPTMSSGKQQRRPERCVIVVKNDKRDYSNKRYPQPYWAAFGKRHDGHDNTEVVKEKPQKKSRDEFLVYKLGVGKRNQLEGDHNGAAHLQNRVHNLQGDSDEANNEDTLRTDHTVSRANEIADLVSMGDLPYESARGTSLQNKMGLRQRLASLSDNFPTHRDRNSVNKKARDRFMQGRMGLGKRISGSSADTLLQKKARDRFLQSKMALGKREPLQFFKERVLQEEKVPEKRARDRFLQGRMTLGKRLYGENENSLLRGINQHQQSRHSSVMKRNLIDKKGRDQFLQGRMKPGKQHLGIMYHISPPPKRARDRFFQSKMGLGKRQLALDYHLPDKKDTHIPDKKARDRYLQSKFGLGKRQASPQTNARRKKGKDRFLHGRMGLGKRFQPDRNGRWSHERPPGDSHAWPSEKENHSHFRPTCHDVFVHGVGGNGLKCKTGHGTHEKRALDKFFSGKLGLGRK